MKEYKFLKTARIVFFVLAWVVLAIGIIGGIGIFVTGGASPITTPAGTTVQSVPKALGIIPIIQGGMGFFIFYTISQIIKALLEIKDCCAKPAV
ncbi:MAG: hypothetical protein HQ572_03910 [Candidatus Omnitrophica bacterium]|nr:hypothetical protein [Candidatus Omnitrophota bacterium]